MSSLNNEYDTYAILIQEQLYIFTENKYAKELYPSVLYQKNCTCLLKFTGTYQYSTWNEGKVHLKMTWTVPYGVDTKT